MRTRQQQRILHESFQALLKMVKNHMDISPTKHLTSHIHDRPTHIRQCEGFYVHEANPSGASEQSTQLRQRITAQSKWNRLSEHTTPHVYQPSDHSTLPVTSHFEAEDSVVTNSVHATHCNRTSHSPTSHCQMETAVLTIAPDGNQSPHYVRPQAKQNNALKST